MGRVGEVIIRTWQVADSMKKQRGTLEGGDEKRMIIIESKDILQNIL